MIYTDLTKKAMKLAYDAHRGQVDKGGIPYIYHPIHLAEQMDDEDSTAAALLHDAAEDTALTVDDLRAEGFGEAVIKALTLLRHDDDVPYMEYVERISHDPLARRVKLADLIHNSDLSRLDSVDEESVKRNKKYCAAIELLTGKNGV